MSRFENLFKNTTKEQSYEIFKKMSLAVEDIHREELFKAYRESIEQNKRAK